MADYEMKRETVTTTKCVLTLSERDVLSILAAWGNERYGFSMDCKVDLDIRWDGYLGDETTVTDTTVETGEEDD